jgi:lycopene beta-cyclase
MLFMDWRDDHTAGNEKMHASNEALPTFLYAMPFSKTKWVPYTHHSSACCAAG